MKEGDKFTKEYIHYNPITPKESRQVWVFMLMYNLNSDERMMKRFEVPEHISSPERLDLNGAAIG